MAELGDTGLDAALRRETAWRIGRARGMLFWLLPLVVVLGWSAARIKLSLIGLADGLPHMIDFLGRMFPPQLSYFSLLWTPAIETVQIAAWGTVLAVVLSIPLALLAARNTSPNVMFYGATRVFLNLLRSINELIYALIFVSAVGLGPFPGVLAIALHATGMLAKFWADEMEHADRGQIEALQAAGANRIQVILFGIIPQVLPAAVGYILYRFDVSIRSATVLGLVGAGGLGFSLITTMKLFKYHQTAACILAIIVLVWAADWISNRLRRRLI
jgi:phosphonate transport system permease protein